MRLVEFQTKYCGAALSRRFRLARREEREEAASRAVLHFDFGAHQFPLVVRLHSERSPDPVSFDAVVERPVHRPILVRIHQLVRRKCLVRDHRAASLWRDVLLR